MRWATRASFWCGFCLPPQPLKLRPTASSPPAPSVRKTGPVSRIQQSSTGIEPITVTSGPHMERALATLSGFAHMMTGSYFAMVRATSAMFDWTPLSCPRQMLVLSGHAIQVWVWGSLSSGTQ